MKPEKYILMGLGIASAILISFLVGQRCPRNGTGEPQTTRVDTLVIRDTIKVTEAVSVTKKVIDSVLVPVTDTITLRDTLWVILEKEQVTWEDSLARVYASGINPQVDSVIHFTQDLIITKEIPVIQVKKTKFGLGFQAGVGVERDKIVPYIGVSLSYNILSW